jgi:hypothetical protein
MQAKSSKTLQKLQFRLGTDRFCPFIAIGASVFDELQPRLVHKLQSACRMVGDPRKQKLPHLQAGLPDILIDRIDLRLRGKIIASRLRPFSIRRRVALTVQSITSL